MVKLRISVRSSNDVDRIRYRRAFDENKSRQYKRKMKLKNRDVENCNQAFLVQKILTHILRENSNSLVFGAWGYIRIPAVETSQTNAI